jgi:hypothetical protein
MVLPGSRGFLSKNPGSDFLKRTSTLLEWVVNPDGRRLEIADKSGI